MLGNIASNCMKTDDINAEICRNDIYGSRYFIPAILQGRGRNLWYLLAKKGGCYGVNR